MQNIITQNPLPPYYAEPEDVPIYKIASCIPVVGTIISIVCRQGLFFKGVGVSEVLPKPQMAYIFKLILDYSLADIIGLGISSIIVIISIASNIIPIGIGTLVLGCNLLLTGGELFISYHTMGALVNIYNS